jgi:small subunit ribosomal protein S20
MPQHKSAMKRVRTTEKKRLRNKALKSAMRSAIKRVRTATDKETATHLLQDAYSQLDKAAKKRVIHPNKAAREKSHLAKFVQNLG